ncbi:MAG: sulfatase-like hydrolase/transferase [Verrucomicrobia bacterium]|nr:sulfatase-like hydrolase/transferase [Verrucomicrobiota bacterium]
MHEKRQIILIMTDTQRKDMLGCYRSTGLQTPHLDQLAESGMRFERAYCCDPVCGPARSALFTGQFPHTNGSWGNTMPLGDTVKTLGQRLTQAGIHAAYVGKWHLDGGDYFGMGRCPDGWDADYWYDMRNYLESLSPEDRVRSRDAATNRSGIDADFTFAHRCSDRAISFLDNHVADDFLLVVSYDEPHHPFLCPEPYASMYADYMFPKTPAYGDDLKEKPEHQQVWAGDHFGEPADERDGRMINPVDFFGCHSFVDFEIGRVLGAIDVRCPGALAIYTSDHGDLLGHRGIDGKGPALYDDLTNIPLLVRWPGRTPAGSVCNHPVSHIDFVPTILDVFGIQPSRVLDGQSQLATFRDPTVQVNDYIFSEYGRYEIDHDYFGGFQPIRCVFDGRYKLVINLLTSDELYDLHEDPYELTNRIGDQEMSGNRNRLHDRLIRWMNESRDPFRGYYWLRRPWRVDAPAASWDFGGYTRQREEDTCFEPWQLEYLTGLEMTTGTRKK